MIEKLTKIRRIQTTVIMPEIADYEFREGYANSSKSRYVGFLENMKCLKD